MYTYYNIFNFFYLHLFSKPWKLLQLPTSKNFRLLLAVHVCHVMTFLDISWHFHVSTLNLVTKARAQDRHQNGLLTPFLYTSWSLTRWSRWHCQQSPIFHHMISFIIFHLSKSIKIYQTYHRSTRKLLRIAPQMGRTKLKSSVGLSA